MKKENGFLKCILPFAAMIAFVGLCYVAGSSRYELVQYTIEGLITLLLVLLIRKVYFRKFAATEDYTFRLPDSKIILGIFLLAPFLLLLKNKLLYYHFSLGAQTDLQTMSYILDSFFADLITCISGVILGPINEELVFRYLPLAHCKKRISRIFNLVFYGFIFAVLHSRNFVSAFADGLFFGVLFLLTRNITYPIFFHAFHNLSGFLLSALTTWGLLDLEITGNYASVLIFSRETLLIFLIPAMFGILLIFGTAIRLRRNSECPTT